MLNKSLMVFLVNKDVRAIAVKFQGTGKEYTYKTIDKTIKAGDFVACYGVSGEFNMSVCKVTKVDLCMDVEDNSVEYKWIISKIDVDTHKELVEKEDLLKSKVNSITFQHKKKQLMKALKISPAELKKLSW